MSNIPEHRDALVISDGPGGAYTACCLAREGIDTVVLEADVFPRYHIGESMLPSMRHFLRFIDLYSTFDNYGFKVKRGDMFKLNPKHQVYKFFRTLKLQWDVRLLDACEADRNLANGLLTPAPHSIESGSVWLVACRQPPARK